MKKAAFLFFCIAPFYSWSQVDFGAFAGAEAGIFFPSPSEFKEVYASDVLSYGFSGGIGSDWLYAVVKHRRFSADGVPVLGNIDGPNAKARWEQSATLGGLRFIKKQQQLDFHFDVLYYATNAREDIRLNDPDFTILDRSNRMNASGLAFGAGFEKNLVSVLSLSLNTELATARTRNKNGLSGKNINLGYFFIGLGLNAKIF